jgi:hypothetical protein
LHPTKQIHDVAENLLERISGSVSLEQIYPALLGKLMLVRKHPEAAKVENLRRVISDDVIEKYPLDVFLQAAGNKLLELEEDLEELEIPVAAPPFQYPPFQKALPYFPNYGYQVTFVLSGDHPDENTQKNLVGLIIKMKGDIVYIIIIVDNFRQFHHLLSLVKILLCMLINFCLVLKIT